MPARAPLCAGMLQHNQPPYRPCPPMLKSYGRVWCAALEPLGMTQRQVRDRKRGTPQPAASPHSRSLSDPQCLNNYAHWGWKCVQRMAFSTISTPQHGDWERKGRGGSDRDCRKRSSSLLFLAASCFTDGHSVFNLATVLVTTSSSSSKAGD